MRRRELLWLIGIAGVLSPRAFAQAQARVGWLTIAPHPGIEGFRAGMRELGWVEGETLTIDYAYGEGRPDRMSELAATLAKGHAQLIIASGSDAVVAARSAITDKPVIAVSTGAALGIGESLARRAGNFTGIALLFDQTAAKWVEMLSELLPRSSRLGVIHDSSVTNMEQFETVRRTASALGYEAVPFRVESAHGLEQAIASTRQERIAGLIFVSSPSFTADAARLAMLVQATGLPAVYESRWIVEKGGLMSYGPDFGVVFRRAASLADRLLKGAKPADLPIEQPTQFYFTLNRATARALGFELPTALLLRADEVIE